jgi:antitoxin CptB
MTVDLEARRKRVLYRSRHRGTREMDEIMGAFAARHVASLADSELVEFEHLLECPDPELYDWITGASSIPAERDGPVMRLLQGFSPKEGR